MDESSFSFKTSGEGALTTCKKSNIFLWNRQGTVRLFDSRLQLSKRTFCKILSNCRSERDVETGLNWPKSSHLFRLGRSDSHLEQKEISAAPSAHGRFPLNIRNLSWTFGCKFVMIPGQPQPLLYFNDFHFMIPTNSGARFSKVPKFFGQISGDIILLVSSKQWRLEAQDYSLYKIWKDQLHRISESEFYKWLFGPVKFSGFSRNVPQDWFLETHIYQVTKARDNSALQVRTIKIVVT